MNKIKKSILALFVVLTIIATNFVFMTGVSAAADAYEFISATTFDKELSYTPNNARPSGGYLGYISEQTYLAYKVDFGSVSPVAITSESTQNREEIYTYFRLDAVDGPVIAAVPITPMTWGTSVPVTVPITMELKGEHVIYVNYQNSIGKKEYADFLGFQFQAPPETFFEYETYNGANVYTDLRDDSLRSSAELLWSLGILRKPAGEDLQAILPVSRGEFADAIYGILQKRLPYGTEEESDDEDEGVVTGFLDVASDSECAEAVAYLSQNGIMNGTDGKKFEPAKLITNLEAVTVIMRVLGYEQLAKEYGGYPTGYITLASKAKLIQKTNLDEIMTRADLVTILDRTLTTDYLSLVGIIVPGYEKYEKVNSVLEVTQNIFYGSGRIIGTSISGLGLPDSGVADGMVSIDGITYNAGSTNAMAMLGYECEFFYEENHGIRTLCAITAANGVEISEIASSRETIIEISDDSIVYAQEGSEKNIEVEIDDETSVFYNGVVLERSLTETLSVGSDAKKFNGFINVVKNPDGSRVIFVEEYVDYTIETVNNATKTIVFDGKNRETIVLTDNDYYIIKDETGESITLKRMAVGDVVTAYVSKNSRGNRFIRVYRHKEEFDGTVTEMNDGDYFIDGKKYVLSNNRKYDLTVGQKATFVLNLYGDIVAVKATDPTDWKLGVFVGLLQQNTGFDKKIQVRLLTEDAKFEVYDVAKKITADGLRMTNATEILNRTVTPEEKVWMGLGNLAADTAVRYKLNSDGELSTIDTPQYGLSSVDAQEINDLDVLRPLLVGSEDGLKYYRHSGLFFNNVSTVPIFYLPNTGMAFGFYGENRTDGSAVVGTINDVVISDNDPTGDLYSTTGHAYTGDLFVWRNIATCNATTNNIVFKSYESALRPDGSVCLKLNCRTESEDISFYLDESGDTEVATPEDIVRAKNLKPGDIIKVRYYPDNTIYSISCTLLYDGAVTRNDEVSGATLITPTMSTDKQLDGASATKYVYGTVTYKGEGFMVVDCDGQNAIVLTIAGTKVQYINPQKTLIGASDAASIEIGDVVFTYVHYGSPQTFVVYSGIEL